ncbi:MAG TPA: hypothetical protein VKE74_17970 [Gemmataceae bacterium]|nr:hypothetical protein [Gemmataceae bacterium]
MILAPRKLAFLVFCGVALFATGCGGNKDKIVGKWKVESGPGTEMLGLFEGKAYMFMEFAKDGTMKMGFEFTDPAMKEKLGKAETAASAKYTVSGDTLEVQPSDNAKDGPFKKGENTAKIKFDGNDKLTLSGKDGEVKLTRMK